jgi:hypothetical protein
MRFVLVLDGRLPPKPPTAYGGSGADSKQEDRPRVRPGVNPTTRF